MKKSRKAAENQKSEESRKSNVQQTHLKRTLSVAIQIDNTYYSLETLPKEEQKKLTEKLRKAIEMMGNP